MNPPTYRVVGAATVLTFYVRMEERQTVTVLDPPTTAKNPRNIAVQHASATFRGGSASALDLDSVTVTGVPLRPARSIETWVVRYTARPGQGELDLDTMPDWLQAVVADLAAPASLHVSKLSRYSRDTPGG